MIEPGPRIRRADRFMSEQVFDGPLEPDCGWVACSNRGKPAIGARQGQDAKGAVPIQDRHVDLIRLAPQADQRQLFRDEALDRGTPSRRIDL